MITARSLLAESELREVLSAYSNPLHPVEEEYIRQWGAAVQAFEATKIPPGACDMLPALQEKVLTGIPFSYPTPVVATQWRPRQQPQSCGACPGVTHCSQLILPEARCAGVLKEWWRNATLDLSLIHI